MHCMRKVSKFSGYNSTLRNYQLAMVFALLKLEKNAQGLFLNLLEFMENKYWKTIYFFRFPWVGASPLLPPLARSLNSTCRKILWVPYIFIDTESISKICS